MSVYLGQLGRLVELKCPASQQVSINDGYFFQYTLEKRVRAQAPALRRRVWNLSVSEATTPRDQAAMLSFGAGEWGNGPFVFVSADAPVTNMLTPAAASCDPSEVFSASNSAGGPLLTPDGWAGRSIFNSTPTQLMWFGTGYTPVIPGQPVTASAYLLGANARVRLYFYDATGAGISNHLSTVTASAGTVVRSHVTVTAPANAASCRLLAADAVQGARPAITWTNSLFDWAAGEGCPKAVIHAMSKDVTLASRDPSGGRYGSLSYTVTEVG